MSAQDRQTLSLPSLRNLQAFIAVANALSIHQAAEQLNVTPSAVSHQIASLESWLGKKLFIRSGKGFNSPRREKISAGGLGGDERHRARHRSNRERKDNAVLRVHSSPPSGCPAVAPSGQIPRRIS